MERLVTLKIEILAADKLSRVLGSTNVNLLLLI